MQALYLGSKSTAVKREVINSCLENAKLHDEGHIKVAKKPA